MRDKLISFFKSNPKIVQYVWRGARFVLRVWGWFVPIQNKTMIFCSFGGRKFDDSPKAVYNEVCRRHEFDDWRLIWAFVDPDKHIIPKGEKIKVDTISFFKALLYSKVWVSNSGMDRGIDLMRKCNVRVETWHGAPLKKIGGEENQNSLGNNPHNYHGKLDVDTIRCAQSEYDREIFARINHADSSAILICDLPRNDELFKYSQDDILNIKRKIGIDEDKKVILYVPTYREYLVNENKETFIAPPMNLEKWEKELRKDYVLLMRAHYAVTVAMHIKETDFVKDVSSYPFINDLYIISDLLISDYSSSFIDYSILNRPMLCFAYDLEEYKEKRGLYIDLKKELPCEVDSDEDCLLQRIKSLDYLSASERTKTFHNKYAPFAGNASKIVVDTIINKLK